MVVLDQGGAGAGWRLLAFDADTLDLLGTRDLVPTGNYADDDGNGGLDFFDDMIGGGISIAADESENTIMDPSTFVLLWDDPVGNDPDLSDGVGGLNWYTIADNP